MGSRIRGVAVVAVVLAVGAFLGSAVSQWRTAPAERAAGGGGEREVEAPPGVRVRVEVLNGGGRRGMARAATDHLRDRGFDVVYYGNARSFDHDSSVVYDRVEVPEQARAVAEALGIPVVRTEPDPNLYLDVTVVLGAAWEPPVDPDPPASAADSGRAVPAWWDIRRFFREDDRPEPMVPGRMADPGEEGNDGR